MLALATHPLGLEHLTGPGHPERPARLTAVLDGVSEVDAHLDVIEVDVRPAPGRALRGVHDDALLTRLRATTGTDGDWLDPDTYVSARSFEAAELAAGAGLAALSALEDGEAAAALVAVRPPGHHAARDRSAGFCLVNNIAVAGRHLADGGARVAIIDWDVHHGDGTQAIFWDEPDVLYVSIHQAGIYPGSGALTETGGSQAPNTTINLPLPAGATGDVYRHALDAVVAPAVTAFEPDWVLVSAGFDAHRADPLAGLHLSSGDFGDLARRVSSFVPAGRLALFLEGGYDLDALRSSTASVVRAVTGRPPGGEPLTEGGPGGLVVDRAAALTAAD